MGVSYWNGRGYYLHLAGGVRHDPQRIMGKNVIVVHFTRDTIVLKCITEAAMQMALTGCFL